MPHLKCICFLQPSEDSISSLELELREPKYGEYYLCQSVGLDWCVAYQLKTRMSDFSNILSKRAIERLAEVDEHEIVREVQVRESLYIEIQINPFP